jgi:cytidylate kinase
LDHALVDFEKVPDVIAIDGPAASGKTTVGKMLAERLTYLFLDTGCMYRAVTHFVLASGIDPHDKDKVVQIARDMKMTIEAPRIDDGRLYTVRIGDEDVTWEIRSPEVNAHVSTVSAYKKVREEMVRRQREMGEAGKIVMVGRDIGTVVLPEAPLKLFITASPEERAQRRWQDRQKRGGTETVKEILADVLRRDHYDSSRLHSPLRPAEDAIIIDSTHDTPNEMLGTILGILYHDFVVAK